VAAGTRIDAIIVATTPDGRVEVETKLGRFLMQPNVALPKDGPIQLQVQTLARQIYLAITSIHGKQPAAALRGLGLGGAPVGQVGNAAASVVGNAASSAASAAQTTAAAPPQLAAGATLTATVLKSINSSAQTNRATAGRTTASGPGAAQQSTAGQSGAKPAIASAGPSGAGPPGSPANPVAGARAAAAYGGQTAARIGPTGSVLVPSGNAFTVRIAGLTLPGPGSPPAPPATTPGAVLISGQSITGIVSSSPAPNTTVVQTRAGPVSLAAPANLPAGTSVQFDVLNQLPSQPESADNSVTKRMALLMLQSRQWPALDETMGALRENNPAAALQLINATLPRPDAALAANILQFLMGVRGGELAAWLGDASARALQHSKPDLLNRLRDDFRSLGRMAEEPVSGDWRALPVPMANGAEVQQIQLLLRRIQDDQEDEEENAGPGTRFVIDVDLTRMGRMQLDGYVQDRTKRFDLIVRSENQLAEPVQNDIRAIFVESGEITGTTGGLTFQAAPPKFIDVARDNTVSDIGLVV